MLVFVIGKAPV